MKTKEIIKNYEQACNDILEKINTIYFDGEASTDWVGEEIGGTAMVSDYFFLDIDFMLTALKEEATEKQFFDWKRGETRS